jgi:hypothetical protein
MNALQTQVEDQFDAFLLDPGMGPMLYLTADGRIINDNRTWDGGEIEVEMSLDNAICALVAGAKKTGISELLGLIPLLSSGATCPKCLGTRWVTIDPSVDFKIICVVCFGRGEVDERLLGQAREHGLV